MEGAECDDIAAKGPAARNQARDETTDDDTGAVASESCVFKTAATQRGRTGITEVLLRDWKRGHLTNSGRARKPGTDARRPLARRRRQPALTRGRETTTAENQLSGTVRGRVRFLSGGRLRTTNNNQRSRARAKTNSHPAATATRQKTTYRRERCCLC